MFSKKGLMDKSNEKMEFLKGKTKGQPEKINKI